MDPQTRSEIAAIRAAWPEDIQACCATLLSMSYDDLSATDAAELYGGDINRAISWLANSSEQKTFHSAMSQLLQMGFKRGPVLAAMKKHGTGNMQALINALTPRAAPAGAASSTPQKKKEKSFEEVMREVEADMELIVPEATRVIETGIFDGERQFLFLKERLLRDVMLKLDAVQLPRRKIPGSDETEPDPECRSRRRNIIRLADELSEKLIRAYADFCKNAPPAAE